MKKTISAVTLAGLVSLGLNTGKTYANEIVEVESSELMQERCIDEENLEFQPDPGPMGAMGRPYPEEDWEFEEIEDEEIYEEICPPDEMFENWVDPDLVEPDPGPMGSMGRPQSPEEEKEWENPKTGDFSLISSVAGLSVGTMGLIASRKRR